jgi:hypothetical protein
VRFSDPVTLQRRTGTDAYGNPRASWDSKTEAPAQAFVVFASTDEATAYLPAGTDVLKGDRVVFGPDTFDVSEAKRLRSPSREVMATAKLRRVVT